MMNAEARPQADTLPCLFAKLTEIYSSSRNKSIHINQRKRLRHTIDKNVLQLSTADNTPQLKAVNEIGIQVSLSHPDMDSLLLQLSQNEANLYALEFQRQQDVKLINKYRQIINDDQQIINELKSQIKDLLFENQQSINIGKQKHCHECDKNEIENSKCKCPQYNAKLLTLAKIQQETEQITPEKEDSTKSFIFRSHKFETDISDKHTNSISITQRSIPQKDVNIPDIHVPDPLPVNPNSITNVHKVLDHIQEISGINNGLSGNTLSAWSTSRENEHVKSLCRVEL
ncbi:1246_t:CDS:2, partial [Funneliformis caledonium]